MKRLATILKVCPICGGEFTTKLGGSKPEKQTCSRKCSNTFFRSFNNPNFVRLDKRLELHYTSICWRYHKKQCVVCGEERIVSVHHYNGVHDDDRPENLVPLCPTHHQYWHSRYRDVISNVVDRYVVNFKNLLVAQRIECHATNVEVAGSNPAEKTMNHLRFHYNEFPTQLAIIKVKIDDKLVAIIRPPCHHMGTNYQYSAWLITSLHDDPTGILRQQCDDLIKTQPEYKGEKIRHHAIIANEMTWQDNGTYHAV